MCVNYTITVQNRTLHYLSKSSNSNKGYILLFKTKYEISTENSPVRIYTCGLQTYRIL